MDPTMSSSCSRHSTPTYSPTGKRRKQRASQQQHFRQQQRTNNTSSDPKSFERCILAADQRRASNHNNIAKSHIPHIVLWRGVFPDAVSASASVPFRKYLWTFSSPRIEINSWHPALSLPQIRSFPAES